MQGDRRACRPSSRSVTRMAGTEGTEATGVDGDSSSGASTLDAEGQSWYKDAEEADRQGSFRRTGLWTGATRQPCFPVVFSLGQIHSVCSS